MTSIGLSLTAYLQHRHNNQWIVEYVTSCFLIDLKHHIFQFQLNKIKETGTSLNSFEIDIHIEPET